MEKRCIIDQAPAGYTEHVRDPKPYLTAEGKIRFVLGAQRENLTGTALIYEMDDLNATPRLIAELEVHNFDNSNVFMWECPDLFSLGGKDLFVWSPQGKLRESHQFQNNYHATYALGELNGNRLRQSILKSWTTALTFTHRKRWKIPIAFCLAGSACLISLTQLINISGIQC